MSGPHPPGMELVPLTQQDIADLIEAHEYRAGPDMPARGVAPSDDDLVVRILDVVGRTLSAHGFDRRAHQFMPTGSIASEVHKPELWGYRLGKYPGP